MSVMNKSCLYSTVQNTSGAAMTFGFLPPHGRKLAAGEELTIFGNIIEDMGRSIAPRRNQLALARAIDAGTLAIINTPSVIMKDTVTGDAKMVQCASGALSAVDPCWAASDSSSDGAVIPAGHDNW